MAQPGVETAAELLEFFNTSEFATSMTHAGGTVVGIFDNVYSEDLSVAASLPMFECRTSDVSALAVGTAVTVNSTSYTIANKKPDGSGVTQLILETGG